MIETTPVLPFCETLRLERRAAGLTQVELAVKAGVSVSTLVAGEAGKRLAPSAREKLERALAAARAEAEQREESVN